MNILSVPMRVAVLLLLIVGFASGCGQRGELYLRDNPPPGMKPPRPEPYKAVPYPQPAGEEIGTDKKR